VRSSGRHGEDGINGCVVEVAKPSERTNLYNVQLAFAGNRVIPDMNSDHAADDDMVNLIKGIPGQSQRAMEPTLEVNR
jgi:hypothetical protein